MDVKVDVFALLGRKEVELAAAHTTIAAQAETIAELRTQLEGRVQAQVPENKVQEK